MPKSRTIPAALAKRIKLVGLDIDGVFTDGGLYVGLVADHPLEFKRFHVLGRPRRQAAADGWPLGSAPERPRVRSIRSARERDGGR